VLLPITATTANIWGAMDYVFPPRSLFQQGNGGAVPAGVMNNYVFVPNTIHASPGQVVTVYNMTQLLHRIVADDNSFDNRRDGSRRNIYSSAGKAGTRFPTTARTLANEGQGSSRPTITR